MKILIATGIYPPDLGGPAEYAVGLEDAYRRMGHSVVVKAFGKTERGMPSGLRHVYYMLRCLWAFVTADRVIVLDTWSVALPIAMLSSVFHKEFVIRTGGDFLWESYVERTEKPVLLREFYTQDNVDDFTYKERFIFNKTRSILRKAKTIIYSTDWQRQIWQKPYLVNINKTRVVENYIGERIPALPPATKSFVGSTRAVAWKNIATLEDVFASREVYVCGARLDCERVPHDEFIEKIRKSYAVILVSLGDISPNMILDAVRCGKPFICTRECGLYDKLKSIGLWVDPQNPEDIRDKVVWLSDENNYHDQCLKVAVYRETHSWSDIAKEIIK